MFLYEKLPEPTKDRVFYTDKDAEAFAERFADFPISGMLKVKVVFPERITCAMFNLEEGIVQNWSWGRIVLAEDACHKFTPNAGRGFQNGVQDVIALCNRLRETIPVAAPELPTTAALVETFKAYHEQRAEPLQQDARISANLTRLHAWSNWGFYLAARFLMTLKICDYILFSWIFGKSIQKGLVLDYVSVEEPFHGLLSWEHPVNKEMSRGGA